MAELNAFWWLQHSMGTPTENVSLSPFVPVLTVVTREGFLRKNIVAVSFFQNCAIHQYS